MKLTPKQEELLKKIITAKLTPAELEQVTQEITKIKSKAPQKER